MGSEVSSKGAMLPFELSHWLASNQPSCLRQNRIGMITTAVNYQCFPHAVTPLTLAYPHAGTKEAAGKQTHTNTHTGAHRLWRKPSPCKPTSLPMSGTDLGQS